MFDVKTEEGVVTGRVNGIHMDAAVAGSMAGIELSLDRMHAFDGHRETRRTRLVLDLDMEPQTMRDLAVLLAVKSGLPAFTELEWRQIATALEIAAKQAAPGNFHGASWSRMAAEIETAYSR